MASFRGGDQITVFGLVEGVALAGAASGSETVNAILDHPIDLRFDQLEVDRTAGGEGCCEGCNNAF
jgi:hypothetical protein